MWPLQTNVIIRLFSLCCIAIFSSKAQFLHSSTWCEWLPWSPCSVSCGIGVKTRYRECKCTRIDIKSIVLGTKHICRGSNEETMPCNLSTCLEKKTGFEFNIVFLALGVFGAIVIIFIICFCLCKLKTCLSSCGRRRRSSSASLSAASHHSRESVNLYISAPPVDLLPMANLPTYEECISKPDGGGFDQPPPSYDSINNDQAISSVQNSEEQQQQQQPHSSQQMISPSTSSPSLNHAI